MYTLDLKNLKYFGNIITLCQTHDIIASKIFDTRENLISNIINFCLRLDLDKIRKVLFIVSMDFNIDHSSSEKSNLLFLRNKSKEECWQSILNKISIASWEELFYVQHIIRLEHWGHISFEDIIYEKSEFENFMNLEDLRNLNDSGRFEKFAKFKNFDENEKWEHYDMYMKFDEFHVHITKIMRFKSPWKKRTDKEVKTLYQKEVANRIKNFTHHEWVVYNSLIRLNNQKIIFFL